MPSIASTLSLGAVLGGALAAPLTSFAASTLFARQEAGNCPTADYQSTDWCSLSNDDRVIIRVSDVKVPWGEVDPAGVDAAIREPCNNGLCQATYSVSTLFVDGNTGLSANLNVAVDATGVQAAWMTSMLDGIKAVLDHGGPDVIGSETKTWLEPQQCPTGQCQPNERESIQINGPDRIELLFKEPDPTNTIPLILRGNTASINIAIGLEVSEPGSFSGACGGLAGSVGTVISFINPVIGGVLGNIGGLVCATVIS